MEATKELSPTSKRLIVFLEELFDTEFGTPRHVELRKQLDVLLEETLVEYHSTMTLPVDSFYDIQVEIYQNIRILEHHKWMFQYPPVTTGKVTRPAEYWTDTQLESLHKICRSTMKVTQLALLKFEQEVMQAEREGRPLVTEAKEKQYARLYEQAHHQRHILFVRLGEKPLSRLIEDAKTLRPIPFGGRSRHQGNSSSCNPFGDIVLEYYQFFCEHLQPCLCTLVPRIRLRDLQIHTPQAEAAYSDIRLASALSGHGRIPRQYLTRLKYTVELLSARSSAKLLRERQLKLAEFIIRSQLDALRLILEIKEEDDPADDMTREYVTSQILRIHITNTRYYRFLEFVTGDKFRSERMENAIWKYLFDDPDCAVGSSGLVEEMNEIWRNRVLRQF